MHIKIGGAVGSWLVGRLVGWAWWWMLVVGGFSNTTHDDEKLNKKEKVLFN
jgi:Na+/phosphate symporter